MSIKIAIFLLGITTALLGLWDFLRKRRGRSALWLGICICLFTVGGYVLDYVDFYIHRGQNEEVRKKLPDGLDFFTSQVVRFNSGAEFPFESNEFKIDIHLSRIYRKDGEFHIALKFDVEDKENNVSWIEQTAEVELQEGNVVKGQTDRLDLYFYVEETTIGNAEISIGIKEVKRGIIIKSMIIRGNAFTFK